MRRNLLKPALARGELHCIGATTLDEYQKYVEKDPALQRRFQPVFVGEPTVEDTISILRGLKEKYELHHGVRITDGAIVGGHAVQPLHRGPLPARQGHRPDGRGRQPHPHGSGKQARGNREPRPRIIQLKIEERRCQKETDQASKDRLEALREELANLEQQSAELTTRWQNERDKIAAEGKIKEQLDAARSNWSRRSAMAIRQGGRADLWPHPRAGKAAGRSRGRQPERAAARGSDRRRHRRRRQPLDRRSGRPRCWKASARSC
jgi:ATP-dependent Clp protease ATP-binding subunit ClpB